MWPPLMVEERENGGEDVRVRLQRKRRWRRESERGVFGGGGVRFEWALVNDKRNEFLKKILVSCGLRKWIGGVVLS